MVSYYKTIVISDVHLGARESSTKQLVNFLKQYKCDNLILNGDIIDGRHLKTNSTLKKKHIRFFNRLLKMISSYKAKVIYVTGNHDSFLNQITPLKMGNISIVKDYIYKSNGKKYFVTHGDIFDDISFHFRALSYLGNYGYRMIFWLNKKFNSFKILKKSTDYSLSKIVKSRFSPKGFVREYENKLIKVAELKKCDGIICGHIHEAAIKSINNIQYLNAGDWIDSLSALVEDHEGEWILVFYNESPKVQHTEPKTVEIKKVSTFKLENFTRNSPHRNLSTNAG